MDQTVSSATATGSGGGSGGGIAPFLVKTYEMVDHSASDEIVSWSTNNKSFIVWNPPEFARLLLPTYFKHNNFSSFIRQLNTYGFHKIDPEKWEFANEDFVKGRKHLLKNIQRKKPVHSHSSNPQGVFVDPERAGFEEEIEKLSREKTALEANVLRFGEERSAEKHQMEKLMLRADQMERRQETLFNYLESAVQDPAFVEHLVRKIECMDDAAYNKKRRLPQPQQNCVLDYNNNNNNSSPRAEFGNIFQHDFSSKLRLELSPAVSGINLMSRSRQCSDEDGASPRRRGPQGTHTRPEGLSFASETLDILDTGTSFTFKMDPLQQILNTHEEPDNHISCLLNLTLASSSFQVNRSPSLTMMSQLSQEIGDSDTRAFKNSSNMVDAEATLSLPKEGPSTNQKPSTQPKVRVNDVFWEQFLTERPGSSDDEDSNSDYQANPHEEDRSSSHEQVMNAKNMEQLSL